MFSHSENVTPLGCAYLRWLRKVPPRPSQNLLKHFGVRANKDYGRERIADAGRPEVAPYGLYVAVLHIADAGRPEVAPYGLVR